MSRRTTSAARHMLALNDCRVFDRHQWHATFTVGQYLCTTCGATYYCPGCTLSIPKHARARPCPEHHAEQQTAPIACQRRLLHGSVYIGLTLLCMVVGFVLFCALATWWQHTDDYLHYGVPRTSQMDAVVGRQDSAARPSHFLALNLDGHLSVIEMQGGDLGKTVIYAGPIIYGQGADLVAVTLSVAHDQRGQPELVLHYQNNEVILYNGSHRRKRPMGLSPRDLHVNPGRSHYPWSSPTLRVRSLSWSPERLA